MPGNLVKRVRAEVLKSVAVWSARPAVIVVELDAELRPRVEAAARSGAGRVPVIVARDQREALRAVSSSPAVLLWVGDHPDVDVARVVAAAVRRCPVMVLALRAEGELSGCVDAELDRPAFEGTAEELIDRLDGLVGAAGASWRRRLDRHAEHEISARLGQVLTRKERAAAGCARAAAAEEPTLHQVLRQLFVQRLLDHDLVVSDAAASLGLARRVFYRRCRALGIEIETLRRPLAGGARGLVAASG